MPPSTTNGTTIHYETAGVGPAFVFVHANPFDHRLWMGQVAEFSARFRCVAVDIRGYGRSDKVETPFTLADMMADVLGVLEQEGITEAVMCGCSVGSGIALLTALEHPELVKALVLVGGNSKGSTTVAGRVKDFEETRDLKGLLEGYLKELVAPGFGETRYGRWVLGLFAANAGRLSARAIARIHRARGACDMSGRLGEIGMPTLVVNGIHDNSLAAGRETAAGIRAARHVVLPDTGHACPIEDPAAFNTAVATFLADNGLLAPVTT